ncbi:hypothetical protein ACFVT5_00995 [Streptomyces sp. NPDC058001]|uniref:hypothetical protein n=1 Tax=Streptomyces sp. NPDC058001 TaxID=3346300 RepID=UPI0036E48139
MLGSGDTGRGDVVFTAMCTFIVAALTGSAALLGLVGCDPDHGDTTAPTARTSAPVSAPPEVTEALRAAHTATDRAGSARVDAVLRIGDRMSTTTRGTLGWSDGLSGTLTIGYTGGSMARTMRELGSARTEARFVADVYYARMSDKFAALAQGRHWVKYRYDASTNFAPNQSVALLLAAGDARKVGRETVRGVSTTHYTGTVRVADLPTEGPDAAGSADLRKQLQDAGVTSQRVDVWIDARNLLVKRVERSGTASGAMDTTAHYSDFGAPVKAGKAPPAEDTVDYQDLLDQS